MSVEELVYVGTEQNAKELREFFEKEWPDVEKEIKEHYDEIHEYRLAIKIELEEEEFYRKMISEGWGKMMFGLRMMIFSGDKETHDKIRGWFTPLSQKAKEN